jgi:DegV family protein with EDD domain
MTIKLVADSTCDLPQALIEKYDITIVPVYLNVGQHSYREGVDISRHEFYTRLPAFDPYPTTAAPAVGQFAAVYEKLSADGATEILSMHLAGQLSNTVQAARLGVEAAQGAPVTVLDTEQITLGSGLLVLTAAEKIAAGRPLSAITTQLKAMIPRTRVFGMIDNLESLRRSGRVNWAEFGLGTLLQIKPVLQIQSGAITVAARVRTRKKALRQMVQMIEQFSPFQRIGVIHVEAPEAAAELLEAAHGLFPAAENR